jgi:hypothetical protein
MRTPAPCQHPGCAGRPSHRLLFGPGGEDAGGADRPDAINLAQPVRRRFNNVEHFLAETNGQALAYVYFEGEPGRRAAAKLLTPMRARAIGAEIANLPEPLSAPGT